VPFAIICKISGSALDKTFLDPHHLSILSKRMPYSAQGSKPNVTFSTNEPPKSKGFWASLCCGSNGDVIDYERDQPPMRIRHNAERPASVQSSAISLATTTDASAKSTSASASADRWYLNSKTEGKLLPWRTWRDYNAAYRSQKIDLNDPPLPPGGAEICRFLLASRRECLKWIG
jgi:hypothetical protein